MLNLSSPKLRIVSRAGLQMSSHIYIYIAKMRLASFLARADDSLVNLENDSLPLP